MCYPCWISLTKKTKRLSLLHPGEHGQGERTSSKYNIFKVFLFIRTRIIQSKTNVFYCIDCRKQVIPRRQRIIPKKCVLGEMKIALNLLLRRIQRCWKRTIVIGKSRDRKHLSCQLRNKSTGRVSFQIFLLLKVSMYTTRTYSYSL